MRRTIETDNYFKGEEMSDTQGAVITILSLVLVLGLILLGMWGCPKYRVYQQGMEGQAELERANQNRQIRIAEAEATRDAARSLAEAEIERAKGIAEANRIIGESLRGNEAYLRYLWIDSLSQKDGSASPQIIYVPTETGLPILEAGRATR